MIVHLFEDQKFIDVTIENFESVAAGGNRYIVFSNNNQLKHISRKNDVKILSNSSYKVDLDVVFKDCQFLIIHFLSPIKLYILKHKPIHVKVVWSIWGSDAYDHFQNQHIYEPLTQKIRKINLYQFCKRFWVYTLYHCLRYRVKPIGKELRLLREIHYVSTVLPYEFELIKNEFGLKADYVDYSYGVNEFTESSNIKLGNSVLVGNSATASNNHLDIFDIIKETTKNLIVPLNYGAFDHKKYSGKIIVKGKKLFGDKLTPVTTYLSKDKYDNLLLSCNTAIMYHIRQQALGNIFHALFIGMRVFLNKKSATYKFFKDEGMIIFDLQEDYKLIGVELDKPEKENNRKLVLKLRNRKVIKEKVQRIINLYHTVFNFSN